MRLRKLSFIFIVSLFSISNTSRADSTLQASELLRYFGAGCASQGEWTKSALAYADALIDDVKSVENDPDCRTINGALGQIKNLSNSLFNLSGDQAQRDILSLKKQEEQLLLTFSAPRSAAEQAKIIEELQIVEAHLSSYGSLQGSSQQEAGRGLQALVSGTNLLLQQVAGNERCISKFSSILTGVTSLAGSVQAAALTGGSSLGIAAGIDIMNGLVEFARRIHYGKIINQMASSVTAAAYSCVLETLSTQWCSSNDALEVITLKGNAATHPADPSPFSQGIALLGEDSKIFLNWLDQVRSGSRAGNQGSAELQAATLERDKQVRAGHAIGLGIIADGQKVFNKTTASGGVDLSHAQWAVERGILINLVSRIAPDTRFCRGDCPGPTPFGDVVKPAVIPYFLLGYTSESALPKNSQGSVRDFDSIDPFSELTNFVPSFQIVESQFGELYQLARKRVDIEIGLYLNIDPLKTITDAGSPDLSGESPYASLVAIINYLTSLPPPHAAVGSYHRIYAETLDRLSKIRDIIKTILETRQAPGSIFASFVVANPTPVPDQDLFEALAQIYGEAKLDNGSSFLNDRITWALRIQLDDLLLSGKAGLKDQDAARLIASDDIVAQLEAISGSQDLNLISQDIYHSQKILKTTLQNFVDEFGRGIAQAIYDGEKQITQDDPASSYAVNEMCIKLLSAPNWPSSLPHNVCYGRKLTSIFDGGPSSPVISEELMQKPWTDRVCTYRNYNRENFIFQQFNTATPIGGGKKP